MSSSGTYPPKLLRKREIRAEAVGEGAWVIRGVLTPREARLMEEAAEANGYERATSRGPKHGEALRDHGRLVVDDPTTAHALWADTGLDQAVLRDVGSIDGRKPSGLNPSLRVYRYAKGEVFGAHFDDASDTPLGRTELTFLCYLTGAGDGEDGERLVGGETAFYKGAHDGARELFRVAPEVGAALVFRHGAKCVPHASLAVTRGKKVVLRSDVAYR